MPFEKSPQTLEQCFRTAVQGDASIQHKLTLENYEEADLLSDVLKESDRIWEGVADEIRRYDVLENECQAIEAKWRAEWPEEPKAADLRNPIGNLLFWLLSRGTALYLLFLLGFGIYHLNHSWGSTSRGVDVRRNLVSHRPIRVAVFSRRCAHRVANTAPSQAVRRAGGRSLPSARGVEARQ